MHVVIHTYKHTYMQTLRYLEQCWIHPLLPLPPPPTNTSDE